MILSFLRYGFLCGLAGWGATFLVGGLISVIVHYAGGVRIETSMVFALYATFVGGGVCAILGGVMGARRAVEQFGSVKQALGADLGCGLVLIGLFVLLVVVSLILQFFGVVESPDPDPDDPAMKMNECVYAAPDRVEGDDCERNCGAERGRSSFRCAKKSCVPFDSL